MSPAKPTQAQIRDRRRQARNDRPRCRLRRGARDSGAEAAQDDQQVVTSGRRGVRDGQPISGGTTATGSTTVVAASPAALALASGVRRQPRASSTGLSRLAVKDPFYAQNVTTTTTTASASAGSASPSSAQHDDDGRDHHDAGNEAAADREAGNDDPGAGHDDLADAVHRDDAGGPAERRRGPREREARDGPGGSELPLRRTALQAQRAPPEGAGDPDLGRRRLLRRRREDNPAAHGQDAHVRERVRRQPLRDQARPAHHGRRQSGLPPATPAGYAAATDGIDDIDDIDRRLSMATFAYNAINAQGVELDGMVSAADMASALEQLRSRGLLAEQIDGGRQAASTAPAPAGSRWSSRSRSRSSRASSRR